jgi:hypothetical protein
VFGFSTVESKKVGLTTPQSQAYTEQKDFGELKEKYSTLEMELKKVSASTDTIFKKYAKK